MAVKKKKTLSPTKTKIVVYIGRSLRGLSANTIFNGGYPPHVEQMISRYPNIKRLMIEPSKLQQAKKDVKVKGHILNYFAEHLLDENGV